MGEWLYHLSPKANLVEIATRGLGPTIQGAPGDYPVGLILSDSYSSTLNGHREDSEAHLGYVMLRVDAARLDHKALKPDDVEFPDLVDDWTSSDWRQSLRACEKCRYTRTVPPTAIDILHLDGSDWEPLPALPRPPAPPKLERELTEWFGRVDDHFDDTPGTVEARIVGELAFRVWTGRRNRGFLPVVDWSRPVILPEKLTEASLIDDSWRGERPHPVDFEKEFSELQGCYPPGSRERTIRAGAVGRIAIEIIHPVDLAVSLLARPTFQDDIKTLYAVGLVDCLEFEGRGHEGVRHYIGADRSWGADLEEAVRRMRRPVIHLELPCP